MRLLKNIAVCILAIQMVGSTWMIPLIHLDFELRKEYIAKVLCINRHKPITVCGGKCFLNKQLDKAAQSQPLEAPSGNQETLVNFYSQEIAKLELDNGSKDLTNKYSLVNSNGSPSSFIGEIFKPPRLS